MVRSPPPQRPEPRARAHAAPPPTLWGRPPGKCAEHAKGRDEKQLPLREKSMSAASGCRPLAFADGLARSLGWHSQRISGKHILQNVIRAENRSRHGRGRAQCKRDAPDARVQNAKLLHQHSVSELRHSRQMHSASDIPLPLRRRPLLSFAQLPQRQPSPPPPPRGPRRGALAAAAARGTRVRRRSRARQRRFAPPARRRPSAPPRARPRAAARGFATSAPSFFAIGRLARSACAAGRSGRGGRGRYC